MRVRILLLVIAGAFILQGCAAGEITLRNVEVQSERQTFLDPSLPEAP